MTTDFTQNKRCVHCLRTSESLTADHVVPSSWYPDTTPSNIQRWTAPSCAECNASLGGIERDLLVRLALCVNPKSPSASGLKAKVLRTLGLDTCELPEKEQIHRDRLRAKIRSELIPSADLAGSQGRIPGIGPPDDESAEWAIPIPWAGLAIIAEKIARGCEHRLRGRFVELPYGVRTFIGESDLVPEPFASAARLYDFGPGCKLRRVFVTEDPNIVFYWISIWESLRLEVRIDLEAELLNLDPKFRRTEGMQPGDVRKAMRISPYLRGQGKQ